MSYLNSLTKEELVQIILDKEAQDIERKESEERTRKILEPWQGLDLSTLTDDSKIAYSYAVKEAQKHVDWNALAKKAHRPPKATKPKIIQRPPSINGQRFDSHFELRLLTGPLSIYGENRIKIPYVFERQYEPDGAIPCTNILIECKPVIEGPETCRKLRQVCLQSKSAMLIIFSERGTGMHWNMPRKDGSVITQEEWCEKQRKKKKDRVDIYYTFEDECEEFLKSEFWLNVLDKHSLFNFSYLSAA
ncbi:TPA: hypothetical protein NJ322_005038 [Vibrio parahaemolyticus]|nr:hypothetical protein [Vibrio parahaemolyticus]HCG7105682.1 hypothetical protein [Vibrio parahaemolyticus]